MNIPNSFIRILKGSLLLMDFSNTIRPFTVGRKNWLFADTPKGVDASAAVYSLVETAKANGLNVYTYLQYLLLYMSDTDWQNHPEELDYLTPWSEDVQEECK